MTDRRADSLREFADALRALVAMPVANRTELKAWYVAAQRLHAWMSAHAAELGAVPEFVRHYLIDADIRLKDPVYAVDQTRELMDFVHALERGEMPG